MAVVIEGISAAGRLHEQALAELDEVAMAASLRKAFGGGTGGWRVHQGAVCVGAGQLSDEEYILITGCNRHICVTGT